MLAHLFLAAAVLFASIQAAETAGVTIEASHGGAGNGLTNTTITVKINHVYNNQTVLDEVSYLFITGATGVPLDSITCTPFSNKDGSGTAGQSFNSTTPSLLSTNTVSVGSIVCITTAISSSPLAPPGGLSSSSSALPTTKSAAHHHSASASSLTAGHPTGAASSATSSAASASASQSAGSAASSLYLSGEFFGGLALGAFGLAFVL